jgi:hypothetical protein
MTEYDDLTKEILESQKWMAPPSWGIIWLTPNQGEELEEIMTRQEVISAADHIRQAELILRRVMQTTRKTKGHFKVGMAWSRTAQAKQELDRLLDATKEQP